MMVSEIPKKELYHGVSEKNCHRIVKSSQKVSCKFVEYHMDLYHKKDARKPYI